MILQIAAEEVVNRNWSYVESALEILEVGPSEVFGIVECLACGFKYSEFLQEEDFYSRLYGQVIDVTRVDPDSTKNSDLSRRCAYIGTLIALLDATFENVRILDYGAGYGATAIVLKALGAKTFAYEFSPERAQFLQDMGIDVFSSHAELHAQPTFDAIVCDNVLEHVPQPSELVKGFSEWLSPSGLLYLSVPSCEKKEFNRAINRLDMSINPWEHLNYFDCAHLDSLLAGQGFAPFAQSKLPTPVDVGLRADEHAKSRVMNGLASIVRTLIFMARGNVLKSVNSRFYRNSG